MIAPTGVPSLRDYGRMIRDGWVLILAATMLSAGAAWLANSLVTPSYTATSRVILTAPGPSSPRAALDGNRSSLVRVESYAHLAVSEQVLRRVIVDLQLSATPQELASDIAVVPTPGSTLIDISATVDDAETSRDIANSVAINLIQLVSEIDLGADGPVSEVTLIDEATLPAATSERTSNLVLGAGFGLALSVVLLIASGVRRDAIDSREQVEDIVRAELDNAGGGFR
jgi:capsular polysaccharide biosynthesis protein